MDLIIQSASGLMSITGTGTGETVKTGHSIADITAGLFSLIGALMAMEARHRTGRGQFVDVSMMDTVMSTMLPSFARYLASGVVPKPMGTLFDGIVPYRNFVCADREITMAVASDKLVEKLLRGDRPHRLARASGLQHQSIAGEESRCARADARGDVSLAPRRTLGGAARAAREFLQPWCAISRKSSRMNKPAARNMTPVVQHPVAGPIRVMGVPVQLSETPGRIGRAAPLLGADTAAILKSL